MIKLMKNLFQSNILAPVSGTVINLSDVKDDAFSSKSIGEGVAILPSDNIIKAPIDGKLVMIFKTNHAFAIETQTGAEILVHIGLDTVKLNGKGFKRICEQGQEVKRGQPIIKIHKEYIESMGYSTVTPVLVINGNRMVNLKVKGGDNIVSGKNIIFSFKLI